MRPGWLPQLRITKVVMDPSHGSWPHGIGEIHGVSFSMQEWLLVATAMGSRRFQRNNYVRKGLALMMAASLFMGKSSGISLIDWSRTS